MTVDPPGDDKLYGHASTDAVVGAIGSDTCNAESEPLCEI